MESSKPEIGSFIPETKYRYLILGGFGFIGQAVTAYLYNNGNCAFENILIADKKIKMFARIPNANEIIYNDERVKLKQLDLSRESDVTQMFETHGPFDIVVNCAAETRYEMSQEDYNKNTEKVAGVCASVSQKFNVKKFIHLSDCLVYGSTKSSANEKSKLNPQTIHGKMALAAENAVLNIKDLPLVILRLTIVYGPGDLEGYLSISIVGAVVYKHMKEKMRVMWDDGKRIHTVHIRDVCRAIGFIVSYSGTEKIFNVVDDGDTTQGRLFSAMSKAYGVEIECIGSIKSHLAAVMLDSVIHKMNDKHVRAWFDFLQEKNMVDSPLSVKIYRDMAENRNLNVSGAQLKAAGFTLQHQWVTVPLLDETYQYYVKEGYLP